MPFTHAQKIFFILFLFLFFQTCFHGSPGCPGTHTDQTGLKCRDLPASASLVLGVKAGTTTAYKILFNHYLSHESCFGLKIGPLSHVNSYIDVKTLVETHLTSYSQLCPGADHVLKPAPTHPQRHLDPQKS